MKQFCTSLREHIRAANVINFKKQLLTLTKKKLNLHQDATSCYICGNRFSKKFANGKNYQRVGYPFISNYRSGAWST